MSDMIKLMIEIARRAGAEIVKCLKEGRGSEVVAKGAGGDTTLVIDKVSENTILNFLMNKLGSFTAVSEEIGFFKRGDSELIFIIDPVDGSYNSRRMIPLFTVSIALARGRTLEDVIAGVVHDPYTGSTYWAEKGKGAYYNGSKIKVKGNSGNLRNSLICVSLPLKAGVKPIETAKEIIKHGGRVRALGSASYEACLVARGSADAYIDAWGTLRIVDIAAASLILKEAGAVVLYNYREPTKIPKIDLDEKLFFVTANSKQLMEEIVKILP